MMTLAGLELRVVNVERTLAFYRDVLGGVETAVSPSDGIVLLLGDQHLCLRPVRLAAPPSLTLTFYTDDLTDTLAHLTRCGISYCWEETAAAYQFCDPDGNRIRLEEA